jgi:putative ABC transport system substrate-binding protein
VAGTLATPLAMTPPVVALQESRVLRVGAVSAGAPRSSPHWDAFSQRLGELSYVEGRNLSIEFRSADGRPERFPGLMTELVRRGVDVILTVGPEASLRAAKESNDRDSHRRGGHRL